MSLEEIFLQVTTDEDGAAAPVAACRACGRSPCSLTSPEESQ